MEGMLDIGDDSILILMAGEAVQRNKPEERLSIVGSAMNIADPGVNDPGVIATYKITGHKKCKHFTIHNVCNNMRLI
jgi:hypothetical protein